MSHFQVLVLTIVPENKNLQWYHSNMKIQIKTGYETCAISPSNKSFYRCFYGKYSSDNALEDVSSRFFFFLFCSPRQRGRFCFQLSVFFPWWLPSEPFNLRTLTRLHMWLHWYWPPPPPPDAISNQGLKSNLSSHCTKTIFCVWPAVCPSWRLFL